MEASHVSSLSAMFGDLTVDDDRSTQALCNILSVAEVTAASDVSATGLKGDERDAQILSQDGSFQQIEIMRNISDVQQRLNSVTLDVYSRQLALETIDITHSSIVDERLNKVSEVNGHLQNITQEKAQLTHRLQRQIVENPLRIHSKHHHQACALFPMLVQCLSELERNLNTIESGSRFSYDKTTVDRLLQDIAKEMASIQSQLQTFRTLRNATEKLCDR